MKKKNLALLTFIFGVFLVAYFVFGSRSRNKNEIIRLEKKVAEVEKLLEEERAKGVDKISVNHIKDNEDKESSKEEELNEQEEEQVENDAEENLSEENNLEGNLSEDNKVINDKEKVEKQEKKIEVKKETKKETKKEQKSEDTPKEDIESIGDPKEAETSNEDEQEIEGKEAKEDIDKEEINEDLQEEITMEAQDDEMVTFTIKKGLSSEQIGRLLEKEGIVNKEEFNKRVNERKLTKELLYGRYTVRKNIDLDELITILSTLHKKNL